MCELSVAPLRPNLPNFVTRWENSQWTDTKYFSAHIHQNPKHWFWFMEIFHDVQTLKMILHCWVVFLNKKQEQPSCLIVVKQLNLLDWMTSFDIIDWLYLWSSFYLFKQNKTILYWKTRNSYTSGEGAWGKYDQSKSLIIYLRMLKKAWQRGKRCNKKQSRWFIHIFRYHGIQHQLMLSSSTANFLIGKSLY